MQLPAALCLGAEDLFDDHMVGSQKGRTRYHPIWSKYVNL